MTDSRRYTLDERAAGARLLAEALTAAGIKNEVLVEEGSSEIYDSARVRVFDTAGEAVIDFTVNGKGYTNVGVVYTDGDPRVANKAYAAVSPIVGTTPAPSPKYTKTKARPGGTSFLEKAGIGQ